MQQKITHFVLDYTKSIISFEVDSEINKQKSLIETLERETVQKRNSVEQLKNQSSINWESESKQKQQLLKEIEENSRKIAERKEKIKSLVKRVSNSDEQEINNQIAQMNKDGWRLIQIEPVNGTFEYYNGYKRFATFTNEIIMVWQKE